MDGEWWKTEEYEAEHCRIVGNVEGWKAVFGVSLRTMRYDYFNVCVL